MSDVRSIVRCRVCGAEATYPEELIHGGCAEPFEVETVLLYEGGTVERLEAQLEQLLGAIEAYEREATIDPYFSSPPARKERFEELLAAAQKVRAERGGSK